jgi:predicted transcriptional regulator
MEDGYLEVETRRLVLDLVREKPGLHMREIARRLELSTSLVEYHLRALMGDEMINSMKEGGYRRFYPGDDLRDRIKLTREQKRKLNLLRQKVPLEIICLLLDTSPLQHREIGEQMDIGGSTLSYHLNKLVKAGLLRKVRAGKDKGYHLYERREIVWILMTGDVSTPTVVDGLIETWNQFY